MPICIPQACGYHEVTRRRAQAEFENSRDYKPEAKDWLSSYWAGFNSPNQIARIRNTGVPMNFLKEVRGHLFLKEVLDTVRHFWMQLKYLNHQEALVRQKPSCIA